MYYYRSYDTGYTILHVCDKTITDKNYLKTVIYLSYFVKHTIFNIKVVNMYEDRVENHRLIVDISSVKNNTPHDFLLNAIVSKLKEVPTVFDFESKNDRLKVFETIIDGENIDICHNERYKRCEENEYYFNNIRYIGYFRNPRKNNVCKCDECVNKYGCHNRTISSINIYHLKDIRCYVIYLTHDDWLADETVSDRRSQFLIKDSDLVKGFIAKDEPTQHLISRNMFAYLQLYNRQRDDLIQCLTDYLPDVLSEICIDYIPYDDTFSPIGMIFNLDNTIFQFTEQFTTEENDQEWYQICVPLICSYLEDDICFESDEMLLKLNV